MFTLYRCFTLGTLERKFFFEEKTKIKYFVLKKIRLFDISVLYAYVDLLISVQNETNIYCIHYNSIIETLKKKYV